MDLNDYPQEKRSIPWKPVLLGAVGFLVVAVLLIVSIRFFQGRNQEAVFEKKNITRETTAIIVACENEKDVEACLNSQLSDLAVSHRSSEVCDMLDTQEEQDNCYWALARASEGVEYCKEIQDEQWMINCFDDLYSKKAIQERDVLVCEKIEKLSTKNICQQALEDFIDSGDCSADDVSQECEDERLLEEAVSTLDRSVCAQMSDESNQDDCTEKVLTIISENDEEVVDLDIDEDEDGLTAEQEAQYGSDPLNPDTDNDGYSDGDEVASGYDPNGPGTLE